MRNGEQRQYLIPFCTFTLPTNDSGLIRFEKDRQLFLNYLQLCNYVRDFDSRESQCHPITISITCLSTSVFFRFAYRILFELYCTSSWRLSAGTAVVGFLDGNIFRVFMLDRRAELLELEVSSYAGWLAESPFEEINCHVWQVQNKYRKCFVIKLR